MTRALFVLLMVTMTPARFAMGEERFACNLKALSKEQRATHVKVSKQLLEAVQELKELPNGYGFRLSPEDLTTTAQWISLERRCCPFLTFEMELGKDSGPLWLRITGSEGVKKFLRAELGLEADE